VIDLAASIALLENLGFAAGRNRKSEEEAGQTGYGEVESSAVIHFRGFAQDEQISTFLFLLAFALVLPDLQVLQKLLFNFPCF